MLASPGLRVRDEVAAFRNLYSAPASVSRFFDWAWRSVAPRRSCCRVIRPVSEPSPSPGPFLARAKAIAVSPSSVWNPALTLRPESGELMLFGMHIGTPPSALTMSTTPMKSTTTKSLIRTWVSDSTVLMVHAAASVTLPDWAPYAKAALNLGVAGALFVPFVRRQEGIFTQLSRGMEMSSTRERSAEMWMMMDVSERIQPLETPIGGVSPDRVSEPSRRMFCGRPAEGSPGGAGAWVGRSPSSFVTSAVLRLPLNVKYAVATPVPTNSRSAAAPSAMTRRTVCLRSVLAWRGFTATGAV